jgi:hypothetical protein
VNWHSHIAHDAAVLVIVFLLLVILLGRYLGS